MPQYEWECPKCGNTHSQILTLAEREAQGLVVCNGRGDFTHPPVTMEWVPQQNGRSFKGGGWTPQFHPK